MKIIVNKFGNVNFISYLCKKLIDMTTDIFLFLIAFNLFFVGLKLDEISKGIRKLTQDKEDKDDI